MKRKITVFLLVATFLLVSTMLFSFVEGTMPQEGRGELKSISHRGASAYAPENTMAAFRKGVDMHSDFIEIDVQLSKDGVPIIIHDDTLDRTTDGEGSVSAYTLKELKSLDAGSWFGEEYSNERIPTLDEVLEEFGGKISILVELKSPELYPGVEEKVASALKDHHLVNSNKNDIIIQSFNHASIQKSKELLPEIPHGVLVGNNWANVSDRQLEEFATYADYMNPNFNIVTKELVERVHNVGMKMYPYTIKKQSEADKLYRLGVDGIITDYPEYANIGE